MLAQDGRQDIVRVGGGYVIKSMCYESLFFILTIFLVTFKK